ncbi:hypothetical protein A165_02480 [Vibrio tasmaniensis ZS-17]|uniref:hypothetical protein n=1 Tax=Vibrio tasmaniensis TaxID=212663 RepID=UPI000369D246|nr:hypothetical protein [Vibrio tasmaniensis]OED68887.1 hypothetical protein A165_02480 [Vibrio tasmaniensis ZS-17]
MELNVFVTPLSTPCTENQSGSRRYIPKFDLPMVEHAIARRLDAILSAHNWNKNRFMHKMRVEGKVINRQKLKDGTWKTKILPPRRASIRLEREQTLDALTRAMIYRADYDPEAPFLFEVKASVEELARMIGQLHEYEPGYDGKNGKYRHGRLACDPVHGALEDMEAADLVVVVREFDKESKTNKAKRIFFKPNLFKGFGLTMEDTRKMLNSARKWQEKEGVIKSAKQKRQAEVLRQSESDRIASLDRPSLRNLLGRLKREFTGANKQTKQVMDAEHRLKEAVEKTSKPKDDRSPTEIKLRQIAISQLPPYQIRAAKMKVKDELNLASVPDLGTNKQFDELLLAMLETYT